MYSLVIVRDLNFIGPHDMSLRRRAARRSRKVLERVSIGGTRLITASTDDNLLAAIAIIERRFLEIVLRRRLRLPPASIGGPEAAPWLHLVRFVRARFTPRRTEWVVAKYHVHEW